MADREAGSQPVMREFWLHNGRAAGLPHGARREESGGNQPARKYSKKRSFHG
jgi:hypothetical protein